MFLVLYVSYGSEWNSITVDFRHLMGTLLNLLPITGKLGIRGVREFIIYNYTYSKIYTLYDCVFLYDSVLEKKMYTVLSD